MFYEPNFEINDHILSTVFDTTRNNGTTIAHYVEVWIEKKAMINNFVPILRGRDVTIVPTSGFDSTPPLYASFNRMLYQYHEVGKDVHILYYGDSDPSGEGMDEDLNNRFQKLIDILHIVILKLIFRGLQ